MKYANCLGYTDVHPFEIICRINDVTIEIREMDAERNPSWKPIHVPGGFAGHCINQNDQKWIIKPNFENPIIRIRCNKKGKWMDANKNEYILSNEPRKFYDFNF
jgi:hypothetical protein